MANIPCQGRGSAANALSARLDTITPIIEETAEEGEALGRVPGEAAKALQESGAFKVGIPRELGGYEFSPRQVIDTIAKLSYADASVGWAFMAVQMVTGTTAAYLGPEAAADLYPDVGTGGHALIAGQGTKLGTAARSTAWDWRTWPASATPDGRSESAAGCSTK